MENIHLMTTTLLLPGEVLLLSFLPSINESGPGTTFSGCMCVKLRVSVRTCYGPGGEVAKRLKTDQQTGGMFGRAVQLRKSEGLQQQCTLTSLFQRQSVRARPYFLLSLLPKIDRTD